MNISAKKIILITLIFLFILQPSAILAIEDNINFKQELINPGSFYYPVKRLWEKGQEKLQFSKQSKTTFYKSRLKIRLSELNYVVEKKLLSEVQRASERFAYTAGILTEELVRQNEAADKESTIKEFEKLSKFLDTLRDKYEANTSFWMLIQHDINSLKILSDRLK